MSESEHSSENETETELSELEKRRGTLEPNDVSGWFDE